MVSLASQDVHIGLDIPEINRGSQHFELIGMDELIANQDIQEIRMQLGREVG